MSRYDDGPGLFGYLFRLIVILALVGGIGFLAYAYFGDLSQTPEPRSIPIDINES
ncbi:hypothetical protein [Pararhodobacter sp.]|uniref:hypothetical protein n=1 Tax=Pararhodobacter sp. TaxID=2127056 RepID=UPI002AFE9E84|nr:hypothetical protein [Pararhodobacter sp.]